MNMVEQKFSVGEVVHEISRPGQKLIIIKASGKLYYCKLQENMSRPEIVFAERDLKGEV
jgi:uncharacterized protein YodC (DUF2158 family)